MSIEALRAAAKARYMEKVAVDELRGRELFSYLSPENLIPPPLQRTFSSSQRVQSLNDGLTPFVQLVALRCNAQKAMLNFMDKGQMFFVAEASREQDDHQSTVEDVVFLGCSSVPLAGRVCELTISLEVDPNEPQHALFIVPDLSKDERFSSLPFVTGSPNYRFYAGTPIVSPAGVNIGSLAIMDLKPRTGLTALETKTLCETAAHVMSYLTVHRRAIEGTRALRIGEGFDCFIAGKKTIENQTAAISEKDGARGARKTYGIPPESDEEDVKLPKSKSQLSSQRPRRSRRPSTKPEKSDPPSSEDESSSQHSSITNPTSSSDEDGDSQSPMLFARTANLIRESFELGLDGGVQFFGIRDDSELKTTLQALRRQSTNNLGTPQLSATRSARPPSAPLIAYSTPDAPFCDPTGLADSELEENFLTSLVTLYPSGKMWSADRSVKGSSSEEESQPTVRSSSKNSTRSQEKKMAETRSILKAFPVGIHSVMMVPLWDTSSAAFTHAVFVYTGDETRSFSATTDLTFLRYFSSTIKLESLRLSSVIADKQKSNFVQTISHEMRSPLHGLLGSAEFLESTDLGPFQQSLVYTINSCGRTLLDTINHILDFSKISSFMTSNEPLNRGKKRASHRSSNSLSKSFVGAPPLLQLTEKTDIGLILEEVIDGIALGQSYSSGGPDLTDLSNKARGKGYGSRQIAEKESVEVIVDIQRADWLFMTQPGALRRIVMNLVGNATKATSNGSILVKLRLNSVRGKTGPVEVMTLTVSDTGRGISPEFLKSKIFIPFAQENPLTPGTGLGLSIVRSILTMLGGDIDITSEVGKGTVVRVSIPLSRALPGERSTTLIPHSNGTTASKSYASEDSVDALQVQAAECRVALVGFGLPHENANKDHSVFQSLSRYITDWYGFKRVDEEFASSSSIIILDERDVESFTHEMKGGPGNLPGLIVLCGVASRHNRTLINGLEARIGGIMEFIVKPVGPHKLAKTLRAILDRQKATRNKASQLEVIDQDLLHVSERMLPDKFQEMAMGDPGTSIPATMMQTDERIAASRTSLHAHMAINDPYKSPGLDKTLNEKGFPFPNVGGKPPSKMGSREDKAASTDVLTDAQSAVISSTTPEIADVHILLVDDNAINLRLLQTYMKKRRCGRIALAEDGQQAVDAVMLAERPFDIIFMDISMPVCDGFEATRAIREFERSNNAPTNAMIIALTGLASGDDQSEAFICGVDVYMTKPVKFKEVGKLLDNWEAHQMLKGGDEDGELMNGATAEVGVDVS